MMQVATGDAPVMWGKIVGFGHYTYQYAGGRTCEWPGFDGLDAQLAKLGKHKIGKSFLYIKRLVDVDMKVLKKSSTATRNRWRRGECFPDSSQRSPRRTNPRSAGPRHAQGTANFFLHAGAGDRV